MKKIVFLLILTLLVLACRNGQILYQNKLQSLVGTNKENLVNTFGKPTKRTILSNGTEIWVYTKINDFYMPIEYYDGWLGFEPIGLTYFDNFNLSPYDEIIDTKVQDVCQTKFTLEKGKVVSFQFHGNDCS